MSSIPLASDGTAANTAPAEAASWGRFPRVVQERRQVTDRAAPLPLERDDPRPLLPHGNGRSYGDSCLNDGGILLDCRQLDRILAFDATTGLIRCEAGVLLGDIIERALPAGWFLPVTPGTRFVTVAGAIANDVHGKNHHRAGSFGAHVERFELLRSDSSRRICSRTENADWMRATIGGMGLTGFITWAEFRLRPVEGAMVEQSTVRFRGLDEYFALIDESDRGFEYTVAWVDSMAAGDRFGRGLLFRANHAPGDRVTVPSRSRLSIPFQPPFPLINRVSLRLFNFAYNVAQGGARRRMISCLKFFYPLDGIGRWNRLYGPRGLLQHQSVIPSDAARIAVAELLRASSRGGSFLTVLKRFGDAPPEGILSFARPGVTLTLDFANRGEGTLRLLDELDRITRAHGGAVNPYKDARMSRATFEASFPRWRDILPFKDPRFSSSFWRRVTS